MNKGLQILYYVLILKFIIRKFFIAMISIVVLVLVFVLLITRQIGNFKLKIWQIMSLGALAVLVSGEISLKEALKAIDWQVILFLFSMFVIGVALERSGYLAHLIYKIFKKAKTIEELLLYVLFILEFLQLF